MAYIKSEIQAQDLKVGDIFRSLESVGNLQKLFSYEVKSVKTEVRTMHVGDSGTTREVSQMVIKVVDRANGNGKTKKYNTTTIIAVYRQA